jgi:DNA-binding transcriptional LysR family regulator
MRERLDLNAIDLNLLPKFRALYRHRNVSEAGRELHLTQSALSNALARMRALFGDELFVRTANGMEPTAFAQGIALPIERALAKLETEFSNMNGFEPQHSTRTFKIAMTQLGEAWLAPLILARARALAPDIVVSTVAAGDRGFEAALGTGSIDFAIAHLPELGADFRDMELGVHELVCLLRDAHPLFKEALTLSRLLSCTFAEIVEHGTMYGVLSRAIMRIARPDAMRYRTGNVMALPYVIATTDLVALVPAWFAAKVAPLHGLRLVRIGGQPPLANIRLFWHENFETDPGHLWMRSIIAYAAEAAHVEDALKTVPTVTAVLDESCREREIVTVASESVELAHTAPALT